MNTEVKRVEWGEKKIPYQQWLEQPVFLEYSDCSPIGAEVEALALVGLGEPITTEVMKELGESEKVIIKAWNGLRSKGSLLDDLKQTTINLFRQSVVIGLNLPYKEDLQLANGLLNQAVFARQTGLALELIQH